MTDNVKYDICRTQQELYEEVWKQGYNVGAFSDLFMASEFCCREMDALYSHYQLAMPEEILDFCGINLSRIPKTSPGISKSCAEWCGFFYRYLHFTTGKSSKDIVSALPFAKLARSYPGLHTVDERLAAEIIFPSVSERQELIARNREAENAIVK